MGFLRNVLAYAVSIFIIISCGSEKKEVAPDVSHIDLSNDLIRYDQLIAELDTNNLAEEVNMLKAKYPEFYDIYFKEVLPFEAKGKDEFLKNLGGYLSDSRIRLLQDTTAFVYKNFESEVMPSLNQSFKYMKHYFPGFEEPNVYTFTSEYTLQRFLFGDKDRDGLGIGLDMFLGSTYPYKKIDPNNPAFSVYLTRTFDKTHLTKKVTEILIDDQIGRPSGSRLLDQMIHNGKKLYILDKVLPGVPDSVILEYTAAQTEWVKDSELQMWAFFFDKDMFYESNSMMINKYINPSPTSPGMPDKSPGRTANYLGWQIVKAYMKRNPEMTVSELVEERNTQKIMDESRYKPKRK